MPLSFQLFRVQVFPPIQRPLFEEATSASDYLKQIIEEESDQPTLRWHIGNLESIDDSGYYFRFGRDRKITGARFDGDRFIDEAIDTGTYTHVLLDVNVEVLAIAQKADLSSQAGQIARQLRRHLAKSLVARDNHLTIDIAPIIDPAEIVELIRRALYIRRVRITLTRENAFDVTEDFIRPGQRAVEYLHGEAGKMDVSGTDLDRERVQEVTRSAASTGTAVGVWLRLPEDARAIQRKLKDNPVKVTLDIDDQSSGWDRAIKTIRNAYRRVRHGS